MVFVAPNHDSTCNCDICRQYNTEKIEFTFEAWDLVPRIDALLQHDLPNDIRRMAEACKEGILNNSRCTGIDILRHKIELWEAFFTQASPPGQRRG
jgi:hypothetical protein